MLKYVILGALSYRPLTGYQLKQFIDNSAKHFWYAQTSQIYRTLDALEASGALESQIEPQDDRPDRRIYSLTTVGRDDLLTWIRQPMTELQPTKDELLVRLFFSAQIDKETTLTQLRLQRALHAQQLQVLRIDIVQQIETSMSLHPELKRDGMMWDASRRLGELQEETIIRWLDETIQRIETDY